MTSKQQNEAPRTLLEEFVRVWGHLLEEETDELEEKEETVSMEQYMALHVAYTQTKQQLDTLQQAYAEVTNQNRALHTLLLGGK